MAKNKRFGYGADVEWRGDIIIDYETEKSYDFYEVGKLLNELAEENIELHIQNDFLKDENHHMRELVNKNKQLKDDVYDWKASAEDYFKLGKSLKKENEQLKTQLQNTCDQRDEFHRGARENANRVGQLEKENNELKQQIKEYSDIKGDLIRVNNRLVRRLAEFNISYEDIVGD